MILFFFFKGSMVSLNSEYIRYKLQMWMHPGLCTNVYYKLDNFSGDEQQINLVGFDVLK